jgi:arylsulfatase A-like enzyme
MFCYKELEKKVTCGVEILLGLSLPLGGAILEGCAADGSPASAPRPNIVFILADDLGYGDLSFYNSRSTVKTTNIDSIASGGVAFTNAYVASPVCSPSRCGLMGARFPSALGFDSNDTTREGFAHLVDTMPALLKRQGYVTGAVGKWDLGGTISPESPGVVGGTGVENPQQLPQGRGFDYFYGFPSGRNSYFKVTPNAVPGDGWHLANDEATALQGGTVVSANPARNIREYNRFTTGTDVPVTYTKHTPDEHLTDIFTTKALRFIDDHANGPDPFFLYMAYNAPHDPYQAPDEYYQKYPHITDSPLRIYSAMIDQMDTRIGELLEKLDEKGITGNTMVIFASDNGGVSIKLNGYTPGPGNNFPLRGGKYEVFEGGVRVPLLIRWPDVYPPGAFTAMVSLLDMMPTLAAAAGYGSAIKNSDGTNLTPFIQGVVTGEVHDALYWRYISEFTNEKGAIKYGVRMNSLKYVYIKKTGGQVIEGLFDLDRNAAEEDRFNLLNDPVYADNLKKIRDGLNQWEAGMAQLPTGTPSRTP